MFGGKRFEPIMAHCRLTGVLLLSALVALSAAGSASAQAVSSTVFAGLPPIQASQFQFTASDLLSGAPSYAPSMMTHAMELGSDVVPVPGQELKRAKSHARVHEYTGPPVMLDDQTLEKVR
jgi:hypothetical protein